MERALCRHWWLLGLPPLAPFLLALSQSSPARPTEKSPDPVNLYRLDATFDPATGALATSGTATLIAGTATDQITLYLNKALAITRLSCAPDCRAESYPDARLGDVSLPRTQEIRVVPARRLPPGGRITLSFAYAGRLATEDIELGRGVISPGWTEMSMEPVWYPLWYQQLPLRADVTLRLPAGFALTGAGQVRREADGRWRLTSPVPFNGRITFATSNSWTVRSRPFGRGRKTTLYTVVEEPRAKELMAATGATFASYETAFGPPHAPADDIRILYANRDPGLKYPKQAYSTGGNLVVLDDASADVQTDTLHHEIAHFWFSAGAPGTPHEFLSESIAEFLAMRRGGQVWGADWLRARRAKAAQRSARIRASLLGIDGFTPDRQPLLYDRGAVALWALQDRIGSVALNRVLREAHRTRATRLEQFVGILTARHGERIAAWFKAQL